MGRCLGPFKIRIPCGECTFTQDVILDTLKTELAGVNTKLKVLDWLSTWWKPLLKGGWHAPIVMVNGKVVSQGEAVNRGLLTQAVTEADASQSALDGTHVFGKASCPHCTKAKNGLDEARIDYRYHDVVKNPRAMYEMLARVKPIIGPKTPVTVPQIWVDGKYIGVNEMLLTRLGSKTPLQEDSDPPKNIATTLAASIAC